jgi:hypothetical protein
VAIADFWSSFHHNGKSALAGEGGGVHAHPLSLYKVAVYAPAETADSRYTPPNSSLPLYVLCGPSHISVSALPTPRTDSPEAGVLDEPYSAKPAQRRSHTGPPGYLGWTRFQSM